MGYVIMIFNTLDKLGKQVMRSRINNKSLLITMLALIISMNLMAATINETDPIIRQVKNTVDKEKLVPDVKCVDYVLMKNADPGVDVVAVLEKHGGKCGGDPQAQHRIFSVYVDQKTHEMASDKDDLTGDGILMPLPSPSQKK